MNTEWIKSVNDCIYSNYDPTTEETLVIIRTLELEPTLEQGRPLLPEIDKRIGRIVDKYSNLHCLMLSEALCLKIFLSTTQFLNLLNGVENNQRATLAKKSGGGYAYRYDILLSPKLPNTDYSIGSREWVAEYLKSSRIYNDSVLDQVMALMPSVGLDTIEVAESALMAALKSIKIPKELLTRNIIHPVEFYLRKYYKYSDELLKYILDNLSLLAALNPKVMREEVETLTAMR